MSMDALTAFAALGLHAMSSPRQQVPRDVLLGALEALLAESGLSLKRSDGLSALVVRAAKATSAWLVRQTPAADPSARFLKVALNAMTGDGRGLSRELAALPPRERALAQQQLAKEALFGTSPNDSLPPQTIAAMLKNGVIGWSTLVKQALGQALRGVPWEHNLGKAIVALGELEADDMLTMLARNLDWDFKEQTWTGAYITAALRQMRDHLDPQKQSIIRCLFETAACIAEATPPDWATLLNACNSAFPAELRRLFLAIIGEKTTHLIAHWKIRESLSQGSLSPEDALKLFYAAFPFISFAGHTDTVVNINMNFYAAPSPIRDEVELCIRLQQNVFSTADLESLAARQDPIGAMAMAKLIERSPDRLGEYKLVYPYCFVADLRKTIARAPMAVFSALTEAITPALVTLTLPQVYPTSLVSFFKKNLYPHRVFVHDWDVLTPAQRGVLLGVLLNQSRSMSPQQAQAAVDKCLDGLSADEVAVVAEYARASMANSTIIDRMQESYDAACARFAKLASARGSEARLLPSTAPIPMGALPPSDIVARYIRRGASPSDEQKSAVLNALERVKTPEDAVHLAQTLMEYSPSPKLDPKSIAELVGKLTGDLTRAFLDALSSKWVLAVAIATDGQALAQMDGRHLQALFARLTPREQALLATLKPIREVLGEANAPRPLNKIEFYAELLALFGAVPDQVKHALPSSVGAFVDALLGQDAGGLVPAAVFDYAASLQRGRFGAPPLAAPSLVVRRHARSNASAY